MVQIHWMNVGTFQPPFELWCCLVSVPLEWCLQVIVRHRAYKTALQINPRMILAFTYSFNLYNDNLLCFPSQAYHYREQVSTFLGLLSAHVLNWLWSPLPPPPATGPQVLTQITHGPLFSVTAIPMSSPSSLCSCYSAPPCFPLFPKPSSIPEQFWLSPA